MNKNINEIENIHINVNPHELAWWKSKVEEYKGNDEMPKIHIPRNCQFVSLMARESTYEQNVAMVIHEFLKAFDRGDEINFMYISLHDGDMNSGTFVVTKEEIGHCGASDQLKRARRNLTEVVADIINGND